MGTSTRHSLRGCGTMSRGAVRRGNRHLWAARAQTIREAPYRARLPRTSDSSGRSGRQPRTRQLRCFQLLGELGYYVPICVVRFLALSEFLLALADMKLRAGGYRRACMGERAVLLHRAAEVAKHHLAYGSSAASPHRLWAADRQPPRCSAPWSGQNNRRRGVSQASPCFQRKLALSRSEHGRVRNA